LDFSVVAANGYARVLVYDRQFPLVAKFFEGVSFADQGG
jgi:hypothetical protein